MGCSCSAEASKKSCPAVDPVIPSGGKALEQLTGDGVFQIEHSFEDKRLPLNANELYRLNSSWKGVHRQINDTGVEMFVR